MATTAKVPPRTGFRVLDWLGGLGVALVCCRCVCVCAAVHALADIFPNRTQLIPGTPHQPTPNHHHIATTTNTPNTPNPKRHAVKCDVCVCVCCACMCVCTYQRRPPFVPTTKIVLSFLCATGNLRGGRSRRSDFLFISNYFVGNLFIQPGPIYYSGTTHTNKPTHPHHVWTFGV